MIGKNTSSSRIAHNTALLYVRMLFVMIVDLYMVRIVLNSLGAVDYGIFDVVAGVVLMFQSVSSVLIISTQRFYSYSLGLHDIPALKSIFSSSLNVFLVLSFILLILGESLGVWFVNTYLTIPEERIIIANWIFQFSLFSFIFSIIQIPFSAAVIANEDMGIYAIISILNCVLKLLCALLITSVSFDRLMYYGAYLFLISIVIFVIYAIIGKHKYEWCRYSLKQAYHHRQILSFSGWTICGTAANVGMNQVCTIFVNIFFGPIVNTARAISFQINSAISAFCGSFLTAIRPPMIKAYAESNYEYLNHLFELGNKVVFYLLLIVCLPLFMEMDTILFFWLKTTDPQTVLFSRLIVIYALILSLNNPITFIIHAIGRVKEYHLLVEIPTLLSTVVTFFLFKMGFAAYSSYIVMIIGIVISHIIRVFLLRRFYDHFDLSNYIKNFIIPAFFITVVCYFISLTIHDFIATDWLRVIFVSATNCLLVACLLLIFGLNNLEKKIILSFFSSLKK